MPIDRRKIILILTPTYLPDPASVGQHMAGAAAELARRGHRVLLFTARNGYDDPSRVYPSHEWLSGVEVRRFPASSFGKKSTLFRLLGTLAFMLQCIFHGLTLRNLGGVVITTSPPLSDLAGAILVSIRRVPLVHWAMDLYAAQLLQLGKVRRGGMMAWLLIQSQKFILRRCTHVVTLDRYMGRRLKSWGVRRAQLSEMPPWPHEDHLHATPKENAFRREHGLSGRFVIMYSGNHSPSNPLTTLLQAVVRLRETPNLTFAFVGGGVGKREVEACIRDHQLTNAISLPYQPIESLSNSLGAADVHVVSLGDEMVGIIHPCKIYGAMAAGRPILYLGPRPSHISDLLDMHPCGWSVAHGDVAACERAIRAMMETSAEDLTRMGAIARQVLDQSFTQQLLCGRYCDTLEHALGLRQPATPNRFSAMKTLAITLLFTALLSTGCNKTIREAAKPAPNPPSAHG